MSCLGGASTQILALGSEVCQVCQSSSHGSVGPAAKLMCMVAAKASPGSCSSYTRVWSAEGCLPPAELPRWRSLLEVQSTSSSQLSQPNHLREDIVTREPEVGAVKQSGVLPREMYVIHGLCRPALPRSSTFQREEYVHRRGTLWKTPSDFPFCYLVFILLQCVSAHTVQITGHLCGRHFHVMQHRTV